MRSKFILFFMSVTLYTVNIHAELNYFLPHSNAVMSILDRKYHFEGDTIIEAKRYTKVYEQFCYSETEYSNLSYYAAVREDTIAEKIYCIQVDDGIERLLADFDVKAGDEVMVYSNWFPSQVPAIVKDVDLVLINNQYRKRVNILGDNGNYYYPSDSWVEGLGSIVYGLFFPNPEHMADVGEPPKFLCLHINDALVYQNPQYSTCYLLNEGNTPIPENRYFDFKIYPTIVDNFLSVETENHSYSYTIYNRIGCISQFGVVQEKTINISMLSPGIYYIVFYNSDNSHLYTSKFVKR